MANTESLDLLVDALFDYAGMFPPAKLSFEDALRESAKFSTSLKRPGLVGCSMVLGVAHIDQIGSEFLEQRGFEAGTMFTIAVLGSLLAENPKANLNEIEALSAINEKGAKGGAGASATPQTVPQLAVSYEIKMPLKLLDDKHKLQAMLGKLSSAAYQEKFIIFIEPGVQHPPSAAAIKTLIELLAELQTKPAFAPIGLKLRGSGPSAVDNRLLSEVLPEVAAAKLHFKATAGLHHPVVQMEQYQNPLGFLNLAAALAFLKALGINTFNRACVLECLNNDQGSAFDFSSGLRWKDFSVSREQLAEGKAAAHFSIGSCSLAEPDADLARLYD